MSRIVKLRSTIVSPSQAGAYAAGDEISNSATAGSVVRATYDMRGLEQGKILYAQIDMTTGDASNCVTTASDMELLVFRTSDVPAAVGDNTTNPIAAATRAKAVARFRFDDTGWTGPLGTVAAGTSQAQWVTPTLVQPLATNVADYPILAFNYSFLTDGQVLGATGAQFSLVLRALAAWTPGAVVNTLGVTLDIEVP
jgi:hypothetical protein